MGAAEGRAADRTDQETLLRALEEELDALSRFVR
jgi:hypothetical protein